jgi:hypothetical protein
MLKVITIAGKVQCYRLDISKLSVGLAYYRHTVLCSYTLRDCES